MTAITHTSADIGLSSLWLVILSASEGSHPMDDLSILARETDGAICWIQCHG
jgi:hypothetical protein